MSPVPTVWKAKSIISAVFAARLRRFGSLNDFTKLFAIIRFFLAVSPVTSREALSKPVTLHSCT